MTDPINERKLEHICVSSTRIAETDRRKHYFDAIRLTHRALPELDLRRDRSLARRFLGKRFPFRC